MTTIIHFGLAAATLLGTFGVSFVALARTFRPAPPPAPEPTWEEKRIAFAQKYPVQVHFEADAWKWMEQQRRRQERAEQTPIDITIVKL